MRDEFIIPCFFYVDFLIYQLLELLEFLFCSNDFAIGIKERFKTKLWENSFGVFSIVPTFIRTYTFPFGGDVQLSMFSHPAYLTQLPHIII